MANLRDGAFLVVGRVEDVQQRDNFETKAPNGAKVALKILGGGGGFTGVSIKQADWPAMATSVVEDALVTWIVRPGEYSVQDNSGMSVAFVELASEGAFKRLQEAFFQAIASRVPAQK